MFRPYERRRQHTTYTYDGLKRVKTKTLLATVRAITDASGAEVLHRYYRPYGQIPITTSTFR
ncbi:hypothetical protein [Chelatococcus asaccharovorans]|uniref:hypothetical protein n=1 Tax=Chelatococcus asaccharovorans TaxID=28210 RepID=UPI00224C68C2|nr:hypothetical protein [Chelatococcus asaccharovorans]CAH1670497.1 hypothetical protein CHELA40_13434 [Chelatococcus asaccharovorans]CAH1678051.1 hypothetical protein CHELA17_62186 [Chelatococcus asaccharovorans]